MKNIFIFILNILLDIVYSYEAFAAQRSRRIDTWNEVSVLFAWLHHASLHRSIIVIDERMQKDRLTFLTRSTHHARKIHCYYFARSYLLKKKKKKKKRRGRSKNFERKKRQNVVPWIRGDNYRCWSAITVWKGKQLWKRARDDGF